MTLRLPTKGRTTARGPQTTRARMAASVLGLLLAGVHARAQDGPGLEGPVWSPRTAAANSEKTFNHGLSPSEPVKTLYYSKEPAPLTPTVPAPPMTEPLPPASSPAPKPAAPAAPPALTPLPTVWHSA